MKLQNLLFSLALVAGIAQAQPAHCTAGFQDSSCFGVLLNAPQAQPTCSTAAGWRTTSPAVWEGSHYSTPSCSYTAAPTCGTGYTQTSAPTWNGSSWTGLACTQTTPSCANGTTWNGSICAYNQPTINFPNGDTLFTDDDPYSDPGATLTLQSNGQAAGSGYVPNMGTFTETPSNISNWSATGTKGNTVQVLASVVSGVQLTGGTVNSWVTLSSAQSWTLSYFHGNGCDNPQTSVVQFSFRMVDTLASLGSRTLTFEVNCDDSLGN